jgi:3-dehydroquinate synthase
MAYSITLAHSRGLLNDAQRDEWFNLVSSVGLSMDHELFTEELLAASTEFIKLVPSPRSRNKVEYRG